MTEDEVRSRWQAELPIYQSWADFVQSRIISQLSELIPGIDIGHFLKVPVIPRLKEENSLVDKALFRNKGYADPYGDITDKVGMRFVVLLSDEIRTVEKAILDCADWAASKDRDFEDERKARPLEFAYQSVHYVVRAAKDINHDGHTIPAGTPCEVQVRTLLQHAHSELTHDTIYKPKRTASPEIKRTVAKSMALIEAADDFFVLVMNDLARASAPEREAMEMLARVYLEKVGISPEAEKSNLIVLDAFEEKLGPNLADQLSAFILEKAYVPERIAQRAKAQHLFRQPVVLLAYLFANSNPSETKETWPLTHDELRPVFLDLGISFDNN